MKSIAAAVGDSEVYATIIRADGTTEPLGLVCGQYNRPVKQWWWRLYGKPRAAHRARKANRSTARLAKVS